MDHFLYGVPRLLIGTKGDLRENNARIAELSANGRNLISRERVNLYCIYCIFYYICSYSYYYY
jgi:hypothetical protein